jgi:hypothetical protein
MTDESGQSYPFTSETLLDRALGAEGYYGVFTANMHTDLAQTADDTALVGSALARGVPVVTARQVLTWLDGRNGSRFGSLSWSGNVLSFTVVGGEGSRGLVVMLPLAGPAGNLSSVTLDGSSVQVTTETIKGVPYALFPAAAGEYQAVYAGP